MRAEQTSFLFGANAPFIEELYERYLGDPNAVDAEWRTFFEALGEQKSDVLAEVRGASWAPNGAHVIGAVDPDSLPPAANRNVKGNGAALPAAIAGKTEEDIRAAARDTSRAFLLIRSYRIRGHLEADLDPLGLVRQAPHRELDPTTYGFGETDWDRPILIFGTLGLGEVGHARGRSWTACARPTAARSAWNTCTSPIPTRRRGSRSASSISRTAPSSPSRAAARSSSASSRRRGWSVISA